MEHDGYEKDLKFPLVLVLSEKLDKKRIATPHKRRRIVRTMLRKQFGVFFHYPLGRDKTGWYFTSTHTNAESIFDEFDDFFSCMNVYIILTETGSGNDVCAVAVKVWRKNKPFCLSSVADDFDIVDFHGAPRDLSVGFNYSLPS